MIKQTAVKDTDQATAGMEVAEQPAAKLPVVAEGAAPLAASVPRPVGAPQLPQTGFANLASAIASAMAEIGEQRVVKRGNNTFHHYKYATMQDIMQALTPLMSKYGIIVMQTEVERGFMDNGAAVFATYDFVVLHKSGECWPFPQKQTGVCNARASNGKFDDKAINKCHTAARKYFLLALFQIPTEDEDDADRGDNDRRHNSREDRGGSAPRNAAPPAEAPPPAEKMTPQAIDPTGMKFIDWATQFVTQVNMCDNLRDLHQWKMLNQTALDTIEDDPKAAKLSKRIRDVYDEREQELSARAGDTAA